MMEFKGFSSIENSYRAAYLETLRNQSLTDGLFVVQEKVHGANFSFHLSEGVMRTAKRTSFIDDPKDFYPCDALVEALAPRIRDLAGQVQGKEVAVFGELCGGFYNHADVTPVKNLSPVQRGVCYAPDLQFYAFDVRVDGAYLPVSEANRLFEAVGLFYARTLFSGSLEACLAYPNDFQSLVPQWLGLPPIETNMCEGTIIRPEEPRHQPSGSRVILKNKNDCWKERNKKTPVVESLVAISPQAEHLIGELQALVNENRLANVLSKMGPVTAKDFGRIIGALSRDVMEEFNKDHEQAFADLVKHEQKQAKKRLSTALTSLVKSRIEDAAAGLWP
ncbi:RNA ligase family protein [Acanthopleuribacter pedis]|uniref:RNA ligase (ATP) n=1 Tax=Acanthopleuribacter pedis TaxID=442870 RepID=A0A8J7QRJ6_9BACT|nr:RNA ligase family protein [Acanthopleuribacter pedis]MBO1322915.1 hypothetical protein [Acanthopleuribacter pedis]